MTTWMFNKDTINTLLRKQKNPVEIQYVTSHIGRWMGSFEFVTKCDKGWVSKMSKLTVKQSEWPQIQTLGWMNAVH